MKINCSLVDKSLRHFNGGHFMKYVLLVALMITSSAFAYNSSTVGNDPIREPSSVPEETKEVKPSK